MKDPFGREHVYLRLAVTDRSNLRCTYCMPKNASFQAKDKILSLDEIERLVSIFARLGIRKLRITGGEPTVSEPDEVLEELIASALRRKPKRHPPLSELAGRTSVLMNAAGG